MRETTHVLLVTDRAHAAGEPGGERLTQALEVEGFTSAWAVWDDPYVEWSTARLVAVRAVTDHRGRFPDFVGWAGLVGPRLLHGAAAFRWGRDAGCLLDLERAGIPVVPTVLVDSTVALRTAVGRFDTAVVSRRAGRGEGVVVVRDAGGRLPSVTAPCLVQPLLDEADDEGAVLVLEGRPQAQVRGGAVVDLGLDAARLAARAVGAASAVLGTALVYARVDLVRAGDRLLVREVDVVSPSLHLDLVPGSAEAFAAAVGARLSLVGGEC